MPTPLLACPCLQGANRPSARNITLSLLHQPYFKATTETNGSSLAAALGQLVCEYNLLALLCALWATCRTPQTGLH